MVTPLTVRHRSRKRHAGDFLRAARGKNELVAGLTAADGIPADIHHGFAFHAAAIDGATYSSTLAVTIDAAPEHIWPWLVQMGYRRGGLYSYDWLDRLFGYLDRPSAIRILPEFQRLAAGDEIPIGRGQGFP